MTARIGFIVATLAVATVAASAHAPSGLATHASLELRLLSSRPSGTTTPVVGNVALSAGATDGTTFFTGQSLCSAGGGGSAPANARNVWTMTATLVGEHDGVYTVRLVSQLVKSAGSQAAGSPAAQTLTLRDGGTLMLDMLRDPQPNCDVSSITIQATLKLESDDPSLRQALYVADLWFSEIDPQGQAHTEHITTNVDASSASSYRFSDVAFAVPKVDSRQLDFSISVRLTGTIAARARSDGKVDLELSSLRTFVLSYPGSAPQAGPFFGGTQKTLTVNEGDAIAIDIPQPGSGFAMAGVDGRKIGVNGGAGIASGSNANQMAMTPNGTPVFVNSDRLVVNTSSFFKGYQTRLTIRLRRVQS